MGGSARPVEPEVEGMESVFQLWEPAQGIPGDRRLCLRSSAVLSEATSSVQRESWDAAVFLASCEWKTRRHAAANGLKLQAWAEREVRREAGCWKSVRPV